MTNDWSTPPQLYAQLDAEFHFDYDPCPLRSLDMTSLLLGEWPGRRIFINPPYSTIEPWFNKAWLELGGGAC